MKDPKEEARGLVDRYFNLRITFPYEDSEDGYCIGDGYMLYMSAKQCALICIEETISELTENWKPHEMFKNRDDVSWAEKRIIYLESVKEEISKL